MEPLVGERNQQAGTDQGVRVRHAAMEPLVGERNQHVPAVAVPHHPDAAMEPLVGERNQRAAPLNTAARYSGCNGAARWRAESGSSPTACGGWPSSCNGAARWRAESEDRGPRLYKQLAYAAMEPLVGERNQGSRKTGRLTCRNTTARERCLPGRAWPCHYGVAKMQITPLTCMRALPGI
jgi:hypothetical protein